MSDFFHKIKDAMSSHGSESKHSTRGSDSEDYGSNSGKQTGGYQGRSYSDDNNTYEYGPDTGGYVAKSTSEPYRTDDHESRYRGSRDKESTEAYGFGGYGSGTRSSGNGSDISDYAPQTGAENYSSRYDAPDSYGSNTGEQYDEQTDERFPDFSRGAPERSNYSRGGSGYY